MPFIAGGVSVVFGTLTLITGDAMWVQIKVTLFNTLVAGVLWLGLRTGHNFFRFVFGNTFHYTDEGWYRLTRNVALFFLGTAVVNEVVRLGFDDFELFALDRMFTGVDIWILFKIFVIMPSPPCTSGGRSGSCRSTACPGRSPSSWADVVQRQPMPATELDLDEPSDELRLELP